ncbi:MAG TPA: hypothetical protein VFK13_04270 [Gemmatimonadaceae bacterium]|nr:hypothetical protein [Gemmatimonadaceae bacterium]
MPDRKRTGSKQTSRAKGRGPHRGEAVTTKVSRTDKKDQETKSARGAAHHAREAQGSRGSRGSRGTSARTRGSSTRDDEGVRRAAARKARGKARDDTTHDDRDTEPNPRTTTTGWLTAPKFGAAGSGGAELEPGPRRP